MFAINDRRIRFTATSFAAAACIVVATFAVSAGAAVATPSLAPTILPHQLSAQTLLETNLSTEIPKPLLPVVAAPVVEQPPSAVLGSRPKLGSMSAPIKRFRDGGHAYYLGGRGLHSCTYVGECMDLFAAIGEPVYAFADGTLTISPYAGGSYGHYIRIKHKDGSESIYAHLSAILAAPGPIKAGELIGRVGCSGTSGEFNHCQASEEHLHFEWSGLHWSEGEYGEIPPYFGEWRGSPKRCFHGC